MLKFKLLNLYYKNESMHTANTLNYTIMYKHIFKYQSFQPNKHLSRHNITIYYNLWPTIHSNHKLLQIKFVASVKTIDPSSKEVQEITN